MTGKRQRVQHPNKDGTLWEVSYRLPEPRPGCVRDVHSYHALESRARRAAAKLPFEDVQIREVLA